MRTVYDIQEEMKEGSEWLVTFGGLQGRSSPATYRVAQKNTRAFYLEGPLEDDRSTWRLYRHKWPLKRNTRFLPDGSGFTVKEGRAITTYQEVGKCKKEQS